MPTVFTSRAFSSRQLAASWSVPLACLPVSWEHQLRPLLVCFPILARLKTRVRSGDRLSWHRTTRALQFSTLFLSYAVELQSLRTAIAATECTHAHQRNGASARALDHPHKPKKTKEQQARTEKPALSWPILTFRSSPRSVHSNVKGNALPLRSSCF